MTTDISDSSRPETLRYGYGETSLGQIAVAGDSSSRESGSVHGSEVDTLDIETVPSNPILPSDWKWGIRFDASGTATLVLGMRDYGRGLYTAYFAGLMAGRLGLPFHRIRVYYSAMRPAVLQMPQPSSAQLHESDPAPIVKAVRDLIEAMCERVIDKGRLALAQKASIDAADVGFDQQSGRFFVLDESRSSNVLEIAAIVRAIATATGSPTHRLRRSRTTSPAGLAAPRLSSRQRT